MAARAARPVPLGRTRLANSDDVPSIMKLVTTPMELNFNISSPKAVAYLIEQSILSICQLDVNGNIVGFLATKDYPPVPAVMPAHWEDFVWSKYKAVDLNARNTLFLHLLCFDPVYGRAGVDRILKSLYIHDPYLTYVAMMKPIPDHQVLYAGQTRCEASFKKIMSLERGVPGDRIPTLWIADRKDVCPRLKIRRAVEEDNDDIIPIIERHSTVLRELYGDFYISEIISRHPESQRVLLVCEDKELAVGVLCLNTLINYEALEENYELSPYAGLRKMGACTYNPVREESTLIFEGEVSYKSRNLNVKECNSESDIKKHEPVLPDYVETLLEDDDSVEYKMNIDSSLLNVVFSDENINMQNDISTEPERNNPDIKSSYKKNKTSFPIYPDPKLKFPEPKRYSGEPNAFLLELFAMHPDYDERHGFDLLEVAFEMFPDRDYCVVAVPSSHRSFPLLDHFTLVSPVKFRKQFVKDSLFVAHVNSVRGDLKVRPAEAFDEDSVDRILHQLKSKSEAMNLFQCSISSTLLSSFLLLSENQPVGLVIVGPLQDTSVRLTYDLETEPHRQGSDGMILVGVMSPALEVHTRWYLREIIRQTEYKTLFWTSSILQKKEFGPGGNLISLASHMVPVRPRRYTPNVVDPENKLGQKIKPGTPFALWYVERPMTSLPKVTVNKSIVVVGASAVGLTFLDTLLLGPKASYLLFTNITLVSEHALPAVAEVMDAAGTCVPTRNAYSGAYVQKLPHHYYLDVIAGTMIKIDRKKKCIYLSDGGVKYYDDLILTCGKKFQQPNYTEKPVKKYLNPKLCNRISMGDPRYRPDDVVPPPVLYDNVMIVNSRYEAHVRLNRLLKMIDDEKDTLFALSPDNPVVVYGDCLNVYSCIAALIEIGISPGNINFVEPFPPEDETSMRINCFNNETVDNRVQSMLESLGIKVYRRCYLYNWTASGAKVDLLWFRTFMHVSKLPCFALFYYGSRQMDLGAFKAINECGLVYNDGIIVGTQFDTNDPNIYAAGSSTKYSQRLLTTLHHRDYSSKDLGEALGHLYLNRIDPFIADNDQNTNNNRNLKTNFARWEPVMTFKSPMIQLATFPGPLYYMTVQKPGQKIPNAIKTFLPNQGPTLETNKDDNYFQLQFNALYCIESLCCLSKKPFLKDALCQLYGRHEACFNNLMYKYQTNQIDDLFEYFTQSWTTALYQESIQQVFDTLDYKAGDQVWEYIVSEFGDLFKEGRPGSETTVTRLEDYERREKLRKEAYKIWSEIGGEKTMWKVLSKYLHKNPVSHPYYATPDPSLLKNC